MVIRFSELCEPGKHEFRRCLWQQRVSEDCLVVGGIYVYRQYNSLVDFSSGGSWNTDKLALTTKLRLLDNIDSDVIAFGPTHVPEVRPLEANGTEKRFFNDGSWIKCPNDRYDTFVSIDRRDRFFFDGTMKRKACTNSDEPKAEIAAFAPLRPIKRKR